MTNEEIKNRHSQVALFHLMAGDEAVLDEMLNEARGEGFSNGYAEGVKEGESHSGPKFDGTEIVLCGDHK